MRSKKFKSIDLLIQKALREDKAYNDVTTQSLISRTDVSKAQIVAHESATICGIEIVRRVFHFLDSKMKFQSQFIDGNQIKNKQVLLEVHGKTQAILSGERVALNFLSYLSAIASTTKAFVEKVKPYRVQILDTRKTTPTLRFLERYAVRCAGGYNHRDDLGAMAMIKDNHLCAMSKKLSMKEAVSLVQKKFQTSVELEIDHLSQLLQALKSGAEIVLLDNMSPNEIKKAVAIKRKNYSSVLLEASGGISLKNIRHYAKTGVDRISIGALTHSRKAVDFSLDLSHD